MQRIAALVAGAMLLATGPVNAQADSNGERQVELYSEMWAMAGVCSQFHQFRVSSDALAARLNNDLANMSAWQQVEIQRRKDDKLASIGARIDELLALPRGGLRSRSVEENDEILMTRCQRLATHAIAGDYFRRS